MSQRFSGRPRRERDDYPTPDWVTETVIPHLKAMGANTIWEPAAGEGGMAAVLARAGFRVVSSDLKSGKDFLNEKTWPRNIARCANDVVTNPPYGGQGRMAEKFIEQALEFTRSRNGLVAMLLRPDFDSGSTRRRFFADCPAWAGKLVLLRRIEWFKSLNGMSPSENHVWYLWSWRHSGPPIIAYPEVTDASRGTRSSATVARGTPIKSGHRTRSGGAITLWSVSALSRHSV
jgi:hypothetical protein